MIKTLVIYGFGETGEDVNKREHLHTAAEKVKYSSHYENKWKRRRRRKKVKRRKEKKRKKIQLKIKLTCNPAVPFLVTYF